jgi:membrane protein YdbS with pleckstrin-like domain
MGKEVNVKVIKPPVERVASGKIFRPSKAFLRKEMLKVVAVGVAIWGLVMIGFLSVGLLVASSDPVEIPDYGRFVSWCTGPLNLWTWVLNLFWMVPALILMPYYIRSIEYSVKAESGETMPEIYVKKGVVTVTRKHVPFRTITNISSNAGPFDRLFGVGNVEIETAGYSGSSKTGPEEKLEGIVFYEEVRDFILNELRRFKAPYTTGTEVVHPEEEPVPRGPGLDDEMLITLREIRDLLRGMKDE